MQLSSDINLIHPLWGKADKELCSNTELGIFNRLVDVYVLACAIGIKEDKIISEDNIESPLNSPKSIGRNTHRENSDIRDMMDFMLQNALINSATIDFDEEERLRLAFNPDYVNKKVNAANFLTGFANYGITKIFEKIKSNSSLVVESDLYKYFEELADAKYESLLMNIKLTE